MGLRYLGGFVTAAYNPLASNITTGVNTVQTQGIYTLPQQAQALPSQQWVTDPNFKDTTLLLQADGKVNGAQNNTFLDSSTNNLTITRNGNTTQGTFSPFNSGWSNYFPGSSSLRFAANSAFDQNAGSWTVETWVYLTTAAGTQYIYSTQAANTNFLSLFFSSDKFSINKGGVGLLVSSTNTYTINTWHHVAYTYDGTTVRLFVNGSLQGSVSPGTLAAAPAMAIGESANASYTIGYISNLRVTKGAALYTAAFTPSPTPLTTTVPAGTVSLLTCQNNRFVDNSTNAFALTLVGTPSVQPFAPFAPQNQVYAGPDTNASWSNYFTSTYDGTSYSGTNLSITGNANFNSTDDFTMEAWAYPTGGNISGGIISFTSITDAGVGSGGGSIVTAGVIGVNSTLSITFSVIGPGGGGGGSANSTIALNKWSHVALVRLGSDTNNCSCYINGTRVAQFTSTAQVNGVPNVCSIGKQSQANDAFYPRRFTGYISNVRYVVGTALYSGATYTVPTEPLTAVSGTQLLTCQSSTFVDKSSNNFSVAVFGAAQVQPFNPFSSSYVTGGSAYFDGTGDYLTLPLSTAFAPGTGAFTVDGWIYSGSNTLQTIWAQTVSGTNYFVIEANYPANVIQITSTASGGGTAITSAATLRLNSWNYFCVSRTVSSSNITVWCNGSAGTPTANAINLTNTTYIPTIGTYSHSTTTNVLIGYLANLRYIKNVTLSGGNTPVLTPTPNLAVTNTQALLNYTNAGIYDGAMDNVLETVGNAQVSTSVVKYGSGSMYFDGTGDYLSMRGIPAFDFGTGNFTIETWANFTTFATAQVLCSVGTGAGAGNFIILVNPTVGFRFYLNTGATDISQGSLTGWSTNTWYHLACVRFGTTVTLYRNGIAIASGACSTQVGNAANAFLVGGDTQPTSSNGYYDDFRVTKGLARYTANFTPPQVALPRQ